MRSLWWAKWHWDRFIAVPSFFTLSTITVMFRTLSCIYHWRYRTLATDIILKMEPINHPETSVTNYWLKLGNSLGDGTPQNTSPSRIYLNTKINILNLHFSSCGQAWNRMWISWSCQVTLSHYTKRILKKSFTFVLQICYNTPPFQVCMWRDPRASSNCRDKEASNYDGPNYDGPSVA